MGGKEKALNIGNLLENTVENCKNIILIIAEIHLAIKVGVQLYARLEQGTTISFTAHIHGTKVRIGRYNGYFPTASTHHVFHKLIATVLIIYNDIV